MRPVGNVTLVNAFADPYPRRRRGDPATIQPRPATPGTRGDRRRRRPWSSPFPADGAGPAAIEDAPRTISVVLADDEE